ncbi:MAG: SDR family NAD(P)-dependent oxidoreductase [Planctomycetes bacterium]|nr:SDR family NAD(P)-dependent oxidoreductase [Planctomycetota bacterium]
MDLKGKTVVMTGAGSGIGRVGAVALAKRGAHVVVVARSEDRCKPALDEIKAAGGSAEAVPMDMALLASVREGAARIAASHGQLHALINNAGLWAEKQTITPEGHDETWAVNTLAPHLLTKALIEPLRAAKGRVVNVSSEEHLNGHIHWDDPNLKGAYSPRRAYRQSKLALTMLSITWAEREAGVVTANSLHPGIVGTNLFRNFPKFIQFWINLLMRSPADGAKPSVWLATEPKLEGVTGKFYSRFKERRPHGIALLKDSRDRLWDLVEKIVG